MRGLQLACGVLAEAHVAGLVRAHLLELFLGWGVVWLHFIFPILLVYLSLELFLEEFDGRQWVVEERLLLLVREEKVSLRIEDLGGEEVEKVIEGLLYPHLAVEVVLLVGAERFL